MDRDTRTALLDLAERTARSRGFDGFSYADLAKAIGIRKASIHYHFPTKADLSERLIERYHTSLKERLVEIEAACSSAGERLSALIAVYRSALHDGQTVCLCVAFSICRESLPEAVVNRVGSVRAMVLDWIRATFELGLRDGSISSISDPLEEAYATLAMLEGGPPGGADPSRPRFVRCRNATVARPLPVMAEPESPLGRAITFYTRARRYLV